jgi:hypothetical protein
VERQDGSPRHVLTLPYLTLPYGQGCWGGLDTAENARPLAMPIAAYAAVWNSQSTKLDPAWAASSGGTCVVPAECRERTGSKLGAGE